MHMAHVSVQVCLHQHSVLASAADQCHELASESVTIHISCDCCRYTVFDKVAVNIRVEEGQHGRRSLVLSLMPREGLPEAELVSG